MIEKGRISGGQMALLLFVSTIGITVATIPYLAAKWAKQDMWMTPVPAAASGLEGSFEPSSTLDIERTRGPVSTPAIDRVLSRRSAWNDCQMYANGS